MKKPTILITNDDGIKAGGLRYLISIMRELGDVLVVASEKSNSGQGHAITARAPLRLDLVEESEGYTEYVSNGTPVDCVKLGEQIVLKRKPDMIVSGINHGSNASVNIMYSGTMAAVIEGCIAGIPSIGFSLDDYESTADFSACGSFIKEISVDSARMLKRIKPAPQGRAFRIRKRSNHVTMILGEKNNTSNS